MDMVQFEQMKKGSGFVAALDQSGGSTPKALAAYGIMEEAYSDADTMFQLVHDMRSRIITSPAFTKDRILAAIIFEKTMDMKIDDDYTSDYLWQKKGIVPILKVDKGLAPLADGVMLMKPIPDLEAVLERAKKRHIFGTKMRSVIKEVNKQGIHALVSQQFELAKIIVDAGFIPIVEPEIDIYMKDKQHGEQLLKQELLEHLTHLDPKYQVMLKLTLPERDDFYKDVIEHPNVVRVVALSGGYSREVANEKLRRNPKLIASFSRALTQDLNVDQSDEAFNTMLDQSIQSIYDASIM